MAMGLDNDIPAPRNSHFPYHPSAIPTTIYMEGYPSVHKERQRLTRRREPVWSPRHIVSSNYRYRKYRWCGYCGGSRWSWRRTMVLADRSFRNSEDKDGKYKGGPMYALERGLGWKKMAIFFAACTAIASFGIGSTVQANAIATLSQQTYGISPILMGIIIAFFTGLVVIGGIKSIARVCSMLVPFMALFYIFGCIYILIINGAYVWPAIKLIVESAFSEKAAGGGFAGSTIMLAARYGIARGLFSNESGLGSAPIVAAAAQTRNPVRQALVSSSGTFWDTIVICALTGIVIVSSILAYPDIDHNDGATLTNMAFSKIPYIGAPLLTFGLLTFAFSTILGWELYGERAIDYFNRKPYRYYYRVIYIISVFAGSTMQLAIVWNLADCMNALMAIPNLLSLLFLSGVLVKETREYLWSNQLDKPNDEG